MTKPHNPPAYPMPAGTNGMEHWQDKITNAPQSGMTLRDYFAAAALPAIMPDGRFESYERAAREAYRMADAMLAERERD